MKKFICLSVLLLLLGINSYSQEIGKVKKSVPLRKGKITMKDGKSEPFKHLNLKDNIFIYTDPSGKLVEKNISDVYQITKKGSYAGLGAILSGSIALIGVLEAEREIRSGSGDRVARSDYFGMSVLFTGIGTLVGSFFKKQKTLFTDTSPLTFSPMFISAPDGKRLPMLSLKIKF